MPIQIVQNTMSLKELIGLAGEHYSDLIKGVVDIRLGILALGGEMHADAEEVLLNHGSQQSDLWGFNIVLDKPLRDALVYDSFINIRPRDQNTALEVQDPKIREQMKSIICERLKDD